MDVIILAGGLGTRLRSVVNEVPKCMASVAGNPFLFYLLKYLTRYKEVENVILSVGYLREVIFRWIDENASEFPFTFAYAVEEEPLGTGGGIRLALSKTASDEVLVLNGDTFFDVDITELSAAGKSVNTPAITLALKMMSHFDRYGTVALSADNAIISFNEKTFCESGLINGGVYLINKNELDMSHLPNKFSFEKEVLEKEASRHTLYGVRQDGYFIDIGIPDDYAKANVEFRTLFI